MLYTLYSSVHFSPFILNTLSGQTKLADVSAETDTQKPGTPTTNEPSSESDGQSTPESQDLPSEKSDGEQDVSAMEVE